MGEYLQRLRNLTTETIPQLEAQLETAEVARRAALAMNYKSPTKKSEAELETTTKAATRARDKLEGARSSVEDIRAVAVAEHAIELARLEQEAQAAREAHQDGEALQRAHLAEVLADLLSDYSPTFPENVHGEVWLNARRQTRPAAEGSSVWLGQRRKEAAEALERHRKLPPELVE
ncbi:MAG: hypothetical protein P1P84_01365 [Deferrisomatales bacterium]|nr:hypothetical protein [Deferrisomatales bacterium]